MSQQEWGQLKSPPTINIRDENPPPGGFLASLTQDNVPGLIADLWNSIPNVTKHVITFPYVWLIQLYLLLSQLLAYTLYNRCLPYLDSSHSIVMFTHADGSVAVFAHTNCLEIILATPCQPIAPPVCSYVCTFHK